MNDKPSINMSQELLKKTPIKVPKLTEKQLRQIFVNHYLSIQASIRDKLYLLPNENVNDINIAHKHAEHIIMYDDTSKIKKDTNLNIMFNDFYTGTGQYTEFPLEGFHTLPNGFSYFGFVGRGDETGSYFFIVYWDGTALSAYIPKYGNTYIIDMNVFEGLYNYDRINSRKAPYQTWYKSGYVQNLSSTERDFINTYLEEGVHTHMDDGCDEWLDNNCSLPLHGQIPFDTFKMLPPGVAYRIVNGYAIQSDDYDWKAITQDIISTFQPI